MVVPFQRDFQKTVYQELYIHISNIPYTPKQVHLAQNVAFLLTLGVLDTPKPFAIMEILRTFLESEMVYEQMPYGRIIQQRLRYRRKNEFCALGLP
jgi:hypothetical protein